ncbi:type IV toxin-antitoxin system AbiEi family antitoxin [Pectobacterium versatile]|uniref:type IV toxin-antitoxin system AbiEi family antitoxin n=1 Tax=Pectobacterium versatile TaxID=2488639 RepID=UPI001CF1967E|nr:type IV toxin-antitoxin system AbiEi family antitoxin domain-containing protein [Pectobacterium versatile]MCA6936812.1 type IV toxin-antitoxin system AbiEi family antitoxin domain-containing protein [Pectobacterium versatile]
MDRITAIERLNAFDKQGRYVFTSRDLAKIFHEDTPRAFNAGLNRLVKDGILTRAIRGVYVYNHAKSKDSYTLERIVLALRRGEYNYLSLESALSEYGVISQIPIDRITVMTTGRSEEHKTPFGVIEFTHTKRPPEQILQDTCFGHSPLRHATKKTAVRDLRRVGRNTHLIDESELYHESES